MRRLLFSLAICWILASANACQAEDSSRALEYAHAVKLFQKLRVPSETRLAQAPVPQGSENGDHYPTQYIEPSDLDDTSENLEVQEEVPLADSATGTLVDPVVEDFTAACGCGEGAPLEATTTVSTDCCTSECDCCCPRRRHCRHGHRRCHCAGQRMLCHIRRCRPCH